MKRKDFIKDYWRYYLMLEQRFCETTRYVELTEDNYQTYSLEYVNELQSIGSEIDVLMKILCGFGQNERKNISDYCPKILEKYPDIIEREVNVETLDDPVIPFKGWDKKEAAKSLDWWTAYNDIKHGRVLNIRNASLKNVLDSLAALYILEMYYLKEIAKQNEELDIPNKDSEIFSLLRWETKHISNANVSFKVVERTK